MPRRILIVAYYYPPRNVTGARRPHGLAKWLRRAGHEVQVLTSANMGPASAPDEDALRTRDLLASRLNWRAQSLDTLTGRSAATWTGRAGPWGLVVVPDVQLVSWLPFALAAARRLARRDPPDVVITTSPVESAHGVGLALRRRGVPWIADLRDGWRFESPREEWPTRAQRRLDAAFERRVVQRADAVVTVTEPLSRDLRARYGATTPVETITNGFDPDDEPAALPDAGLDPARLSLVHTGSLGRERTLAPIVEALARMTAREPQLRERVELVVAGPCTAAEQALYARPDVAAMIRHVGFLDRPGSLALQRDADLLLLATSGVRTGEATGKLFEYLAAGRPILVLGDQSAAADIVASAQAGWAIPQHDADAAERALTRACAGELPRPPAAARERYLYPSLAARYADLVEATIARRRGSGGGQ